MSPDFSVACGGGIRPAHEGMCSTQAAAQPLLEFRLQPDDPSNSLQFNLRQQLRRGPINSGDLTQSLQQPRQPQREPVLYHNSNCNSGTCTPSSSSSSNHCSGGAACGSSSNSSSNSSSSTCSGDSRASPAATALVPLLCIGDTFIHCNTVTALLQGNNSSSRAGAGDSSNSSSTLDAKEQRRQRRRDKIRALEERHRQRQLQQQQEQQEGSGTSSSPQQQQQQQQQQGQMGRDGVAPPQASRQQQGQGDGAARHHSGDTSRSNSSSSGSPVDPNSELLLHLSPLMEGKQLFFLDKDAAEMVRRQQLLERYAQIRLKQLEKEREQQQLQQQASKAAAAAAAAASSSSSGPSPYHLMLQHLSAAALGRPVGSPASGSAQAASTAAAAGAGAASEVDGHSSGSGVGPSSSSSSSGWWQRLKPVQLPGPLQDAASGLHQQASAALAAVPWPFTHKAQHQPEAQSSEQQPEQAHQQQQQQQQQQLVDPLARHLEGEQPPQPQQQQQGRQDRSTGTAASKQAGCADSSSSGSSSTAVRKVGAGVQSPAATSSGSSATTEAAGSAQHSSSPTSSKGGPSSTPTTTTSATLSSAAVPAAPSSPSPGSSSSSSSGVSSGKGVLTQQLGDLMSELARLEEEAICVEGQLLEEAGEHPPAQLPFNYSSYVARFPLAAAMHLVHKDPQSTGLVVSDLDVTAVQHASGRHACLSLEDGRQWSFDIETSGSEEPEGDREEEGEGGEGALHSSEAAAASSHGSSTSMSSRASKLGSSQGGRSRASDAGTPAAADGSGAGAAAAAAAGEPAAIGKQGWWGAKWPSSTAGGQADVSHTTSSSSSRRAGAGDAGSDGEEITVERLSVVPLTETDIGTCDRTPVYLVPGLQLSLPAAQGEVLFTPAFLTLSHVQDFLLSTRKLTEKLWLQGRRRERDAVQRNLLLLAAHAAAAGDGGPVASAGANMRVTQRSTIEEESSDEDSEEIPEAKAIAEEMGLRKGAKSKQVAMTGMPRAPPPSEGVVGVLNTLALGLLTVASGVLVGGLDLVDRVVLRVPRLADRLVMPVSHLNLQAAFLDEVVADLAAHNASIKAFGSQQPGSSGGCAGGSCSTTSSSSSSSTAAGSRGTGSSCTAAADTGNRRLAASSSCCSWVASTAPGSWQQQQLSQLFSPFATAPKLDSNGLPGHNSSFLACHGSTAGPVPPGGDSPSGWQALQRTAELFQAALQQHTQRVVQLLPLHVTQPEVQLGQPLLLMDMETASSSQHQQHGGPDQAGLNQPGVPAQGWDNNNSSRLGQGPGLPVGPLLLNSSSCQGHPGATQSGAGCSTNESSRAGGRCQSQHHPTLAASSSSSVGGTGQDQQQSSQGGSVGATGASSSSSSSCAVAPAGSVSWQELFLVSNTDADSSNGQPGSSRSNRGNRILNREDTAAASSSSSGSKQECRWQHQAELTQRRLARQQQQEPGGSTNSPGTPHHQQQQQPAAWRPPLGWICASNRLPIAVPAPPAAAQADAEASPQVSPTVSLDWQLGDTRVAPSALQMPSQECIKLLLAGGWQVLLDALHGPGNMAASLLQDLRRQALPAMTDIQTTSDGELAARFTLQVHAITETYYPGAAAAAAVAAAASAVTSPSPSSSSSSSSSSKGLHRQVQHVTHTMELGVHLNLTEMLGPSSLHKGSVLSVEGRGAGSCAKGLMLVGDLGLEAPPEGEVPRPPPVGLVVLEKEAAGVQEQQGQQQQPQNQQQDETRK